MRLLSFEYSQASYRADFISYGAAVAGLFTLVIVSGPRAHAVALAVFVATGLAAWTVIEYAMHRFIMHGLRPVRGWHAKHHRHATALIGAPTLLSAALIFVLVFLPALVSTDKWRASALTLGVLTGYLIYGITHHAIHQWEASSAWLRRRKHWHELHHQLGQRACYGVTSSFWDHVFRTTPDLRAKACQRR